MSLSDQTHLFEGYLRGSLSKKEELLLFEWIKKSDDNYLHFKQFIANNQFAQSHTDESLKAWKIIRNKTVSKSANKQVLWGLKSNWVQVAAIFVFALLTGFFLNQYLNERGSESAMNEVIVPKGESANLIFSDGTKVHLQAGSHIKYPSIFSKSKREIVLTGEAFFDVVHDQSNPFVIQTPQFDVKVTGTSFNLKTYRDEEWNSLVLHTGVVSIINGKQQFKIKPGEQYSFNSKTKESKIVEADLKKSLLRKEGVIIVDDLSMDELQKVLEREFNVQIRIENASLKKIKYSGQFKPHENLMEVLNLIRKASPIKFKYEVNEAKDIITIK